MKGPLSRDNVCTGSHYFQLSGDTMHSMREWFEGSGLTKNEISNLTGISNTYLKKIAEGEASNVGRDKILVLALVAFDMTLKEANLILKQNGKREINEDDASFLIEIGEKKKVIKSFQPVRALFNFDLLIISLEAQSGDTFLVFDKPHVALMPREPEFMSIIEPSSHVVSPEYGQLVQQLRLRFHKRRNEIFINSLKNGHRFECLLCETCFKKYILLAAQNPQARPYIIYHFRNTIACLKEFPDIFKIELVDVCPRIYFQMKKLPKGSAENDKVMFISPDSPRHEHKYGTIQNSSMFTDTDLKNMIIGFATDSRQVFNRFSEEFLNLKKATVQYDDIANYIVSEFKSNGISKEELLEQQLFLRIPLSE